MMINRDRDTRRLIRDIEGIIRKRTTPKSKGMTRPVIRRVRKSGKG